MKGCLSDFALDRLLAGELDGDARPLEIGKLGLEDKRAAAVFTRAAAEAHLGICDACRARKEALEAEYGAFEQGRFVAGEVARVKQRVREADGTPLTPSGASTLVSGAASTSGSGAASTSGSGATSSPVPSIGARGRRHLRGPAVGALVALAAALLMVVLVPGERPQGDVRLKSGLALEAYHRDESGEVVRLESGATVRTDEAVQLFARLPAEGHVAIVGVDAEGVASLYHPPGGRSARALETGRAAMGRWQMPSSIVFSTPGLERLFLVACEEPLREPPLREAIEEAAAPHSAHAARLEIDCPQATFDVNVVAAVGGEASREEGTR